MHRFTAESRTLVDAILSDVLKENDFSDPDDATFVGLYIKADDTIPFDYYIRAIAFHLKQHKIPIFIIICDSLKMNKCEQEFRQKNKFPESVIYLTDTMDREFDFALMASCNHSIVSNSQGALTALINGGTTVVYGDSGDISKSVRLPWLFSLELDNWYPIK